MNSSKTWAKAVAQDAAQVVRAAECIAAMDDLSERMMDELADAEEDLSNSLIQFRKALAAEKKLIRDTEAIRRHD